MRACVHACVCPPTYPEGEHGDSLGAVDVVPHTQAIPVLGHHHVAARHPLHIGAEAQHRGFLPALNVVQMQL